MATTKLNQKSEKLLKEEKAKLAETDTTENVDETLQPDLNQPKKEAEEESKQEEAEAESKADDTEEESKQEEAEAESKADDTEEDSKQEEADSKQEEAEAKADDTEEDSKQEETKINLLMRDDLLIALGEQNKYAHLECGKHLVGDITDEKLEKFYKEFGYYVTSEVDYVIWHSLKKLFESV